MWVWKTHHSTALLHYAPNAELFLDSFNTLEGVIDFLGQPIEISSSKPQIREPGLQRCNFVANFYNLAFHRTKIVSHGPVCDE